MGHEERGGIEMFAYKCEKCGARCYSSAECKAGALCIAHGCGGVISPVALADQGEIRIVDREAFRADMGRDWADEKDAIDGMAVRFAPGKPWARCGGHDVHRDWTRPLDSMNKGED